MNKMKKMLWIALLIGFSANALGGPNENFGTVVGGITGGILGNNIGHGSGKTAATIGGAVLGSLVGNQLGTSADASECYRGSDCYRYSHWHHYSPDYPRYRNTFIGRDGRLCRHSLLTNDYGDRIYATFCCYHMTPNGYCARWIRTR